MRLSRVWVPAELAEMSVTVPGRIHVGCACPPDQFRVYRVTYTDQLSPMRGYAVAGSRVMFPRQASPLTQFVYTIGMIQDEVMDVALRTAAPGWYFRYVLAPMVVRPLLRQYVAQLLVGAGAGGLLSGVSSEELQQRLSVPESHRVRPYRGGLVDRVLFLYSRYGATCVSHVSSSDDAMQRTEQGLQGLADVTDPVELVRLHSVLYFGLFAELVAGCPSGGLARRMCRQMTAVPEYWRFVSKVFVWLVCSMAASGMLRHVSGEDVKVFLTASAES